ncbi:hypothetical protein CBA19CS11_11810 [Caballeronia novacaledonica]|uniref:LysM peptidoglycan-binding domain-containing protein n=1 Tax=Caballeronia novacaledonica TaxID=1544861 RepID=UPI001EE2AAC0|nr:LysM peptidoglycan-binding domain-containing protein [Caballeronia novacaledonica]GJH09522.1 hypothetical protein CBA19CS11_11810 [Caballeronia novacaledonica]
MKEGDSLWKIAKNESTTVETLVHLNGLKGRSIHALRIGQKLKLPGSSRADPDSLLTLIFRGLDFRIFTPQKIKVEHDGKAHTYEMAGDKTLPLSIHDHSLGLKVWIENLEKKMVKTFECSHLPIGKWNVPIDSRKVSLKGNLLREKGVAQTTNENVRKETTAQAQHAGGNTAQQQARIENGEPVHAVATIYTEGNLRLAPGNEKYRAMIIAAAPKYNLTPQSIAALIGAEASANREGMWRADSNVDHPDKAQGLAQFFPDAWTEVFNYPTSLLCQDCKSMSRAQWMSKRLEAKYAVDGAAAYAASNLRNFASVSGWNVGSLAPEEKAKLAYMLHHEGATGATRLLLGIPDSYTAEGATNRLTKQLNSAEKANQLVAQHHGSAVEAYKSWFFGYVDKKIDVNFYTIKDEQHFANPPRTMAEIVAGLSGRTRVALPQSRPEPATHNDQSANSSITPTRAATANSSSWFDPLEICALRTAHLASKVAAEFGMTRNQGKRAHQGIDLAAEPGTPIRAVANGIIYMAPVAAHSDYAYGNTLVLEVGINDLPPLQAARFRKVNPGRETIGFFYAHLSEYQFPIRKDSKGNVLPVTVHAGDFIGKTGCTGNAKGMNNIPLGAHLHFEVRQDAKKRCTGLANRVDPLPFIVNCVNR